MKKTIVLTLLGLVLTMALLFCAAETDVNEMPVLPVLAPPEESITLGGDDNDAAFEGYVNRLFGIEKPQPLRQLLMRALGASLTGNDKIVYDVLKEQIQAVAAGERSSTVLTVTAQQMGLDGHYYASDLGVPDVIDGAQIAPDAVQNMRALAAYDSSKVFYILLRDCPYEMYWCDKTKETTFSGFGITTGYDSNRREYYLSFTRDLTFSFVVAKAYQLNGESYAVDTTIAQTASTAATSAQGVVNEYASDGDYEKLHHYKNWICDHVSYNQGAAGGGADYGNPWQLIWVFDNDTSTNVVCEGYSKAFQYLCDKSDFIDDVDCRTATGTMGTESHMWNIVEMPNGKNYMVDVTNCDGSSIGAPDKLFLVGCANGNANDGYNMPVGDGVLYKYDNNTRGLYSTEELTLSELSYLEEDGIPIDKAHFPDDAFREIVSEFDIAPQDGYLSDAELEAVETLDISQKNIGDLTGIRYFHALDDLDCSNNALERLDLTNMATLSYVTCQQNEIEELVLAGCTGLKQVDCLQNKIKALDLSDSTALVAVMCGGNPLEELDISGCAELTDLCCELVSLKTLDISTCTLLLRYALYENLEIDLDDTPAAYYSGDDFFFSFDLGVRLIRSHDAPEVLALPADTKAVGDEAFRGTSVELVVIPQGCESIGEYAFADCDSLEEVRIPVSLQAESIDDTAFSGSESAIIVTTDPDMQAWAIDHNMLWCEE